MDSIDKLLAELQTEYKEVRLQQQQSKLATAKSFIPLLPKSASFMDKVLAELKVILQKKMLPLSYKNSKN